MFCAQCAAHPACYLGIEIMPIQAQSPHLFTELSDYHTRCKRPDYKNWMPTLVKAITVLQEMDWRSLHPLQLAKFYNRVCSAIMFTSLYSTINRSQTMISLNALCTLAFRTTIRRVLALTAISSLHSLDYNTVGASISSTLACSEYFYMKAPPGYDNDWGTASLCKFPVNVIFFGLALVLGFGLMPVRPTSQVNLRPSFVHYVM